MTNKTKAPANSVAFAFEADAKTFLESDAKIARVAPSMMVTLVNEHKRATDNNPILVPGHDDSTEMDKAPVTYTVIRDWASGKLDKSDTIKLKARLVAASDSLRKRKADIVALKAKAADLSKSKDESDIAQGNRIKADAEDKQRGFDAALRVMERAMFAAVIIIENPDRAAYDTLQGPARGRASATYTATTKSGKKVERIASASAQLAQVQKALGEYAVARLTPEERKAMDKARDAAAQDAADKAQALPTDDKNKRAPHVNGSDAERAITSNSQTDMGKMLVIKRATQIVLTDAHEAKGDFRQELLALASALLHELGAESVTEYDKANGAA